eukprot:2413791-Pyramimonas_sp.AAC.1
MEHESNLQEEGYEQKHNWQKQPDVPGGRTLTGRSCGRAQTASSSGRVAKASTHRERRFER